MPSISIYALIVFSFTSLFHSTARALEIGIGGGGITIGGGGGSSSPPSKQPPEDCNPPPPPPPKICPPPPLPPPPPPPQICPPPPPPRPPPPPPPQICPPPPPPPRGPGQINARLKRDFKVIQRFKNIIQKDLIKNDPKNVTLTWKGENPCTYKGFTCSPNPYFKHMRTLSDVQFNGFNLGGANLSGFIDQLLDVSIFHANSNRFTGSVPDITAATLPYLFELDLSNNRLTGQFPTQVLQATNLTFLDLRFNAFAGTVPPEVFALDVDVLFINNNNFFQPLPAQLGSTPALYLTLANNRFTGPIPDSIGLARKTLLEVLFLNNRLTGCLPWQIGLLTLARVFDASDNGLHGPIPMSFACLENMQILNFRGNCLDGVVPEMLCALPRLKNLTLSYNYFTEVGPRCRMLIKKKVLDVQMNCILGLPGQRSPDECARFFDKHPSTMACPSPYLHAPCKAARYGNGNHKRRLAAEVAGPVWSATYGALNAV